MAAVGRRLRNELKEFEVYALQKTGRVLGTGSYGTVNEMKMNNESVAVKKIHEFLLGDSDSGITKALEQFEEECKRLKQLIHPNIVKFLGIYFDGESVIPMLVMEYLPTSLCKYVERNATTKEQKTSIMSDVAEGLKYLHELRPPVIHRDLTSNNILLTDDLHAKITDLGVSRLINYDTVQMLTKVPGNLVHMPPEAVLVDQQKYMQSADKAVKLDVFSYGNVFINVMTGEYPNPGDNCDERGMRRTEVQRRQKDLDKIPEAKEKNLIIRCLNNDPVHRPTANELVQFFKEKDAVPSHHGAMAGVGRRLREELEQFVVSALQGTGRVLGRGAYGEVIEMRMNSKRVAVKKIHQFLLGDVGGADVAMPLAQFEGECKRLSLINHPNIVKFLGIYFDGKSVIPMLVMEYLPTSLLKYVERNATTKEQKTSIMLEIAEGLKYLHELKPPLIHRDLTANNILLTDDLHAKITDLGMSRLLNYDTIQRLTNVPGNQAHMPPEALLADQQKYMQSADKAVKLDIFSYGNVFVNVMTGEFPNPGNAYDERGIRRTEVQRRLTDLDKIPDSEEKTLIIRCLNNDPGNRPTANELVQFFKGEREEKDYPIEEGEPIFIGTVPFDVKCPVCFDLFEDPYQFTCCGYHICKTCTGGVDKCPQCRATSAKAAPDKFFARQIANLKVECYNYKKGCTWTGTLREFKQHEDDCPKNKSECRYCKLTFPQKTFSAHADACEETPHPCPNKCNSRDIKRKCLKQHLEQECALRVVKNGLIARTADQSVKSVDNVPVAFTMTNFSQYVRKGDIWYSPPFYMHRYKVQLRVDANRYIKGHTSVMICVLKGEHDRALRWPLRAEVQVRLYNWKTKAPLYNKILHLVGDAFCRQNKTDLPASWGQGSCEFISHKSLELNLTNNTEYVRHDCLNFVIQRATLKNVPAVPRIPTWAGNNAFIVPSLRHMKDNGVSSFCGPPAYSGNLGYKVTPQIHPCGQGAGKGSHVSLSCSLMKGENDDKLQWPMAADITVVMVNWREDKNHKSFTFSFNQGLDRSIVSRVQVAGMAEKSISSAKFAANSALPYNAGANTQYVNDDSLIFKVSSFTVYSDKAAVSRMPAWVDPVKGSPYPCYTLTEFSKRKNHKSSCFSQPLYSHRNGYRVQLQIYAGNGHDVGLYVCLMKGPNDEILQWPFCGDIVLELVNWRSDQGHYKKVLSLSPKCTGNICERVTNGERNTGRGYEHFISHDDLPYNAATGAEYLQDDCLHFRVKEIVVHSIPPPLSAPSWQGHALSPYFQFTMSNFMKRKEFNSEYCSPVFYSHLNGYKLKIDVTPDRQGYVALFVKLLKGENDPTLSWPFLGNVVVELLNHVQDSNHHTCNISFHERLREYNGRVQGMESSGWGRQQFILPSLLPYSQSKNTEYMRSDCLCFRVKVAAYTRTSRVPRWLPPNTPACFTITNISERVALESKYYSPPFTVSKYTMCIKLNFNAYKASEKAKYVAMYACLLKGDDDDSLEWPFYGDIGVEVLNWNAEHGNFKNILSLNSPEDDSHARVMEDVMEPGGYGKRYFMSVSTLFSQYLNDGCMCVRVLDAAIYSTPLRSKQPRWQAMMRATGVHSCTVTNVAWRIRHNSELFGPPFYTHRNGYKMRLEINPGGGLGKNKGNLSLYARLLAGDNDASLKWPMNVTLFVDLLNWAQNSLHVSESIKFANADGDARNRVSKDDESADSCWGFPNLCSHSKLFGNQRNIQYVQDDCIRVRVKTVAVFSKKGLF